MSKETPMTELDFSTLGDAEKKLFLQLSRSKTFRDLLPAETVAAVNKGIAIERIGNKFEEGLNTDENVSAYLDALNILAALHNDFVKPSGTSGDKRIAFETEHGKFVVVLEAEK